MLSGCAGNASSQSFGGTLDIEDTSAARFCLCPGQYFGVGGSEHTHPYGSTRTQGPFRPYGSALNTDADALSHLQDERCSLDIGHRHVTAAWEIRHRPASDIRLRLACRPRFDHDLQSHTVWNPPRAIIDPEPMPISICGSYLHAMPSSSGGCARWRLRHNTRALKTSLRNFLLQYSAEMACEAGDVVKAF